MSSGKPEKFERDTSILVILLIVSHREKITMNAKHTEKLSMYFLIDPGESLLLALDASTKAPIPKITVVMLIIVTDTTSITSEFY